MDLSNVPLLYAFASGFFRKQIATIGPFQIILRTLLTLYWTMLYIDYKGQIERDYKRITRRNPNVSHIIFNMKSFLKSQANIVLAQNNNFSLHFWLIAKLGFYVQCFNITSNMDHKVELLKRINESVINVNETDREIQMKIVAVLLKSILG